MTPAQVQDLVEGCMAANPAPLVPVYVVDVRQQGNRFTVTLNSTASTSHDDSEWHDYLRILEGCMAPEIQSPYSVVFAGQ